MKTSLIKSTMFPLVAVSLLCTMTASASDIATSDDWGTSSEGDVIVENVASDAVTVTFEAVNPAAPPPLRECEMIAGALSGGFAGDIKENGAEGLRFKITGDGSQPSVNQVLLRCEDDTSQEIVWKSSSIAVSAVAGEWKICSTLLDRKGGGWITPEGNEHWRDADYQELWDSSIKNIAMISVLLRPGSYGAETYSVSQFQLIGVDGGATTAVLSPVEAYFDGVASVDDLTDAQKNQDSDGDGMSDLNEMLAGMDPNDASSVLAANGVKGANGNMITWQGILGGSYGVLRSSNLSSGFELIYSVVATSTGTMSYEDTNPIADGANFYKIVKDVN